MKKTLTIAVLFIVIIISTYFAYKNWNKREEIKIDDSQLTTQVEGLIVSDSFETKVLNEDNAYVIFDVKYPYFKNADKDFNSQIENLIKSQMDDHKVASQENWQARFDTQVKGDNIAKVPTVAEDKFSFFSEFTVVQSNSSYISFVLKYGGFSGGAHGYENIVTYNYDVKKQKNIELKDLFINNPQYLNYLSTKSREFLKSEFATVSEEDKKNSSEVALKEYIDNIVSMIESGTEPKDENFSIFTFAGDKVKIYFAQYQVGPYVIGSPEVEINLK